MLGKVLVMNFGSTSTKIAVYEGLDEILKNSINHSSGELSNYHTILEQKDFRREKIKSVLKEKGYSFSDFTAVVSRGGNIKPIKSGIYEITEKMINDIKSGKYGSHATDIGNIIAFEIGKELDIPVITADPPSCDEFNNLARYSGMIDNPRLSSYHALNQKRSAKVAAEKMGRNYKDINLVVVHLGGGISVGAHEKGLVVDVNNALDGEGPFSPERAGTVPAGMLIKMCYSGNYTEAEMIKKIKGGGGLMSYLGTNSGLEVEDKIKNGDMYAKEVFEAMAYTVAKEIGAASTVLKGKVDGIVLTGSLAYSQRIIDLLSERVEFIAPIYVIPGENEMLALAEAANRYLTGKEKPLEY